MKINDQLVLNKQLISDFSSGTEVKVIDIFKFKNSPTVQMVTLEDINFIPTKARPEKRCTVHLIDLYVAVDG